jgi:UDP-N-acetylmuramoyl-L-alanyl-D-glutamate--2,6-diaminopimelate ligase
MSVMSSAAVNITRTPPRKNLRELLAGLVDVDVPDIVVTDLTIDSRKASAGSVFVALPGLRSHGAAFASQAVSLGATVVLWQPTPGVDAPALPEHVTVIAVPKLNVSIGTIADRCFSAPSRAVAVTGITGTNGKTTTAYVLASALSHLNQVSAYAGTLGHGRVGAVIAGTHTTPDCITLHRQIAGLRDDGVTQLAIEISSHALDQQRVAGVRIETAVFTNLTHDHLDYHLTFAAYGAAKARLFNWPGLQHAVINVEDAFGRELAASYGGRGLVVCARADANLLPGCDYVLATGVTATFAGLAIEIDSRWGTATLRSRFVGDFNVDNLLAVLGVLLAQGFPLRAAVAAMERCVPPPGRMETFTANGRPLTIVDYAHTPDALEKALSAARRHCTGKLICVFGCGGDRDARKRPAMGEIAERFADVVIVTDDNPRTEDGDAIVAAIVTGLKQPQRAIVERDRARAIEGAIQSGRAGDVVLVAGKGHEDYQIVGIETRYFSDRDVVQAALRRDT